MPKLFLIAPMPKLFLIAFAATALAIVALGVVSYKNGDRPTSNNQTHMERILCHLRHGQC